MKKAKHPQLDDALELLFDEDKHEYRMSAGYDWQFSDPLPSVTQFVGHYLPKFDAEVMASRTAAKRGVSKDAVLAEWAAKRDASCVLGTRVHENQEALMNASEPPHRPGDEREYAIMQSGWLAFQDVLAHGWEPYAAEKMVFSGFFRLAGTVDAMFIRGREIMVCDWKTNEKIQQRNAYGTKCLDPIAHLDDCEFVKYALQLNLYERILKRDAYIPGHMSSRMNIIHLRPDGHQVIPVPRLLEAEVLLADYLAADWTREPPPF